MLGYKNSQYDALDFLLLGGPGGPWGVLITNAKATGLPTLSSSAHSTGMVGPFVEGIPRLSRVEGRSRKGVQGVQGYWQRIHIAVGEEGGAMEVKEPFHHDLECSTLSIKLS